MHTPHVWPYFMPTSVGALMDPTFLREAVNDAGARPWIDYPMPEPALSGWRETMFAGQPTWIPVRRGPARMASSAAATAADPSTPEQKR